MAHARRFDASLVSPDTKEFTFHLQHEKNFLPDVLLDYPRMMEEYQNTMARCCQPFALVGNDNKMGGVFFLSDIVPEHQAVLYIWIWGKCYTATTHRFMLGYIEHYAEEYQLARVVCRTPDDKRLGRLLERLFFKLESRGAKGYKSGGRLMTLFGYRRLFNYAGGVV